jgi:hypothetical protein
MISTLRRSVKGLIPTALVAGVLVASYVAPSSLPGLTLVSVCSYGYLGAPTVTGIAPTSGPPAGGNSVVITGCGFTGVTSVHFGATAATPVTFNSDSQVTATSPAHASGVVDVTVTTPSGTSAPTAADHFTYLPAGTCSSVTASPAPASPQNVGTAVVITASATCTNAGPLFQFWLLGPGQSAYTNVQTYSTNNVYNWNTTTQPAGTYSVVVWAKDVTSSGTSSNTSGSWDAYAYFTYMFNAPSGSFCTAAGLSGAPVSTASVGTSVLFTATASCPHASPVFQFWTLAPGAGAWTLARAYSTTATFSWATTGQQPGAWGIAVWVKDASSTGTSANAFGTWDAATSINYTLTTCQSVSLAGAPASAAGVGVPVTFTATQVGCPHASPVYQFWTLAPGASAWTVARAYSAVATFSWTTTGLKPGIWGVAVWLRDASSGGSGSNTFGTWDAAASLNYSLTTCTSVTLTAVPASTAAHSTTVTFTAAAMNCPTAAPMYQFWTLAPGASAWVVARAYSATPTFAWSAPATPGSYQIAVWARDASSSGAFSNTFGTWDVANSIGYTLT